MTIIVRFWTIWKNDIKLKEGRVIKLKEKEVNIRIKGLRKVKPLNLGDLPYLKCQE